MRAAKFEISAALLESAIGLPTGTITGLRTTTVNGRTRHYVIVEHAAIPECSSSISFEQMPECDPVIHKSVEDECFVVDWNMRAMQVKADDAAAHELNGIIRPEWLSSSGVVKRQPGIGDPSEPPSYSGALRNAGNE